MIFLSDILPACLYALEGKKTDANLQIPTAKRVVVFLVDGMGSQNLSENFDLHPITSDLLKGVGQATLPSTTPVSLASLGTGLLPGGHGFLGATFLIEGIEKILQPLKWQENPAPEVVQPEKTIFELAVNKYIDVTRIGPAAYADSGLTNAVLRGGTYLPAENLTEILQVTKKVLVQSHPALIYVYYRELDRIGHVHGTASEKWRSELKKVLQCISDLSESLSSDDQMIVTADHGMIDIDSRVWIEDIPQIWHATRWLTGEPRFRHFYAEPGALQTLRSEIKRLEVVADIYSRDEFIATGLVGVVEQQFHTRIGDFVAIAKQNSVIGSRSIDRRSSGLIGNHGGNSATERDIPVAVLAR